MPDLPDAPADAPAPSARVIEQLQARGSQLLTETGEAFSGSLSTNPSDKKKSSGKYDKLAISSTLSASDRTFISTILQSGTSSDKLSALILLSSSSPLHTTNYLTQLLNLTKKKSRDEAVRAIRAIVDWLKGGAGGTGTAGLPDRKLRWFADQPGLRAVAHARQQSQKQGVKQHADKQQHQVGDEHLLLWAFEDWLKKWYFELLKNIETLSHDPLPFVRTQMTGFLAALLSSKPEQEQNLLRLLVDKLGDSEKTVSSRTSYHLLQLLGQHPMMKNIVVKEVAALVLRPTGQAAPIASATGQGKKIKFGDNGSAAAPAATMASKLSATAGIRSGDHARYYGIITLNQIMLSRTQEDAQVANKLIEVYFDIFNDLLGSHDDDIGQAGAGAGADGGELKDRKQRRDEKSGKRKRNAVEEARLKALPRKERRKLEKSQQALEAESKIMTAVLTGVNRAYPYSEMDGGVLHARVDVLFRIIHTGTFNVGIQALLLIFQVSSREQAVSDRFYRVLYDTLVDPRLASCSKQAMYLNLLFKALKADTSAKRTAAFVKRLTQILGLHQPPFVCGALFLLGELFSVTPGLRSMLNEPEDTDDDVEMFKDAPEADAAAASVAIEGSSDAEEALKPTKSNGQGTSTSKYDGKKRDPQYANAANSCLWELAPLVSHFHPSVALHASQLLHSQPITTNPDLELHTLAHFLDRFVYKNAKKGSATSSSAVASGMKPGAKGQDRSGMVVLRKGADGQGTEGHPLNAAEFLKKKQEDVPVDQLFFHRFFTKKQESERTRDASKTENARKRKRRGDADADDSDIDDLDIEEADDSDLAVDDDDDEEELEEIEEGDLDEDEVWKAMQASMPAAGGDGEDAEDVDLLEVSDDDSVADFAYSDTDSDAEPATGGAEVADSAAEAEDEDVEEEEDAEEPQSFFPDEQDDEDGLDGFGEEEADVLDSDEDIMLGDGVEIPQKDGKDKDGRKQKKRKLKHLPAFASADDWAELINAGDGDADM